MPRKRRTSAAEDDGLLALTSSAQRRSAGALRAARARYGMVYRLHVELRGILPTIWRRLLVPEALTLDELHGVLQESMGWTDSHLYEFSTKHATFSVPDPDDDDYGRFVHDTRAVLIGDLKLWRGSTLGYLYDFGDGWRHEITVEDAEAPIAGRPAPACLGGARACPPEDVGGPSGYERMLSSLSDPNHPDHETYREWIGPSHDPERFSAELVNRFLLRAQGVWKRRLGKAL